MKLIIDISKDDYIKVQDGRASVSMMRKTIENGTPLEQEPKTGHWIESDIPNEKYNCSECGGACWYYDYQGDVAKSRFCPNCGAKME